jgi:hypothetical protein
MVYFKVDTAAKSTSTDSNFTAGNFAIAGVAGLGIGAVVTAVASAVTGKKKRDAAA